MSIRLLKIAEDVAVRRAQDRKVCIRGVRFCDIIVYDFGSLSLVEAFAMIRSRPSRKRELYSSWATMLTFFFHQTNVADSYLHFRWCEGLVR